MLVGNPSGRYRLDRRRRLHLRLLCERDGSPCLGRIGLSLPVAGARRSGARVDRRSLALAPDGRPHSIPVRLGAFQGQRLRLSIYLHGETAPQVRATVPIR